MDWIQIFGIEFNINPVAFKLFGNNIYWYGIIIALGFALAVLYGFKRAKDFDINTDRLIDVVLVTTPVSIIGARLYYVIFTGMPITQFIDIRNGGLAIYGAVIAAAITAFIMCKLRKVNFVDALDLAALGFLIGQGIGRWGNFVNQEAYGSLTGSSWFGMTGSRISEEVGRGNLVHPCFLYESIWCLTGFLILHMVSKHRKFKGQIAIMYLIWYGFGRFFIEGLRTDSLFIGGSILRVSQLLSAVMVVTGIVLYIILSVRTKEKALEPKYVSVFSDIIDEEDDELQNENNNKNTDKISESEEHEDGNNH